MAPNSPADEVRAERVVVTGGAGFVGHHLVTALLERGARVLVVDDLSSGSAARVPEHAELSELDLVDGDLRSALGVWRPSVVYHLAAQVSVPRSQDDPAHDLRVNGLGTLRLLEAARAAGTRRVVFVSSGGAIYGDTQGAVTESAPERPASFYGMHKLLAERYVAASGLSYAIARPSNVFGPGQVSGGDGAVVPSFVGAILAGGPLVIHGDGTQSRDFVYVDDVVAGLRILADTRINGVWNVSSGEATGILELADMLQRLMRRRAEHRFVGRRAGDIDTSLLANTKLTGLGWERRFTLEDGLRCMLAA